MSNTYTCSACRNEYEKGWTDAEATEEVKTNFGEGFSKENCDVVCEDCYRKIMG